jgi:hypothetical protein
LLRRGEKPADIPASFSKRSDISIWPLRASATKGARAATAARSGGDERLVVFAAIVVTALATGLGAFIGAWMAG